MDIYLLRHGIAAPAGPANAFQDDLRELTREGIQKMRESAKGLGVLGVKLDWVACSPLVRARQTAEIVVETLKTPAPLVQWKELKPDGSAELVMLRLLEIKDTKSVLLVGHQPSIGCLASCLVCGNSAVSLPFKKGAVMAAHVDDLSAQPRSELMWMMPSKLLRLIAAQ